jgi:hypothetical protein
LARDSPGECDEGRGFVDHDLVTDDRRCGAVRDGVTLGDARSNSSQMPPVTRSPGSAEIRDYRMVANVIEPAVQDMPARASRRDYRTDSRLVGPRPDPGVRSRRAARRTAVSPETVRRRRPVVRSSARLWDLHACRSQARPWPRSGDVGCDGDDFCAGGTSHTQVTPSDSSRPRRSHGQSSCAGNDVARRVHRQG